VYFDILEKAGPKLIPLSEVAEMRRGYTTGINEFFYLTPLGPGEARGTLSVKNARGWQGEIEEACLRPVIKSPKEAKGIRIDPTHLRHRLFLPPLKISPKDTAETLTAQLRDSYPLAYEYVRWGEQQRTPDGTSWPEVPSVKGRKVWWLVREPTFPVGIWPKAFNDRFFILENDSKVACSDRFYKIELKEGADAESFMAFLNSTLMALTLELRGRVNLGDGALDNMAYEAAEAMVLNPREVDPKAMKNLVRAYKKVKQRPIGIIKEELKQPDRRELDKAVLKALGLDPKVYLRPLYKGLLELVTERLRLSKMRAARPKAEERLSDDQLLKQWEELRWPERLKPITTFLEGKETRFLEIPLLKKQPVRYQENTPGLFSAFPEPVTLLNAQGEPVGSVEKILQVTLLNAEGKPGGRVETISQARYAVLAAKPQEYLVRVPADEKVLEEVLEAYEAHLREEGGRLLGDIQNAVRDVKKAKQLFRRLFERAGLPPFAIEIALGHKGLP
jgi:hypothetical protein